MVRLLHAILLGALALGTSAACGGGEPDSPAAATASDAVSAGLTLPDIDPSLNDRDAVAEAIGFPDLLQLSYEVIGGEDEAAGRVVRYETWIYFDLLTAYEFADGTLTLMLPVEAPTRPMLVVPFLDPRLVDRSQTWADVHQLIGAPDNVVSEPLADAYGEDLTAWAAPQFLAVFDADGLVYAETIPLEAP